MPPPPRGSRRDLCVPWEPNPVEVFVLGLCVFAGGEGLIRLAVYGAQGVHAAPAIALLWFVLLFVGGLAAIVGAFWTDQLDGALIMRSAMWPVGAGALAYAVVLFDLGEIAGGVVTAAFGVLALFRARQLARHAVAAIAPAPAAPDIDDQGGAL